MVVERRPFEIIKVEVELNRYLIASVFSLLFNRVVRVASRLIIYLITEYQKTNRSILLQYAISGEQ